MEAVENCLKDAVFFKQQDNKKVNEHQETMCLIACRPRITR